MKKISWKKISYPQSKNFEKILKFISKYDRQKNKIQIIISLSNVIVHTYFMYSLKIQLYLLKFWELILNICNNKKNKLQTYKIYIKFL